MKEVASFFKTLADESRLRMLWLLMNRDELCVCDIMEALRITQSKASRHLATLRHAGLVVDRREGAWSHYSLRPDLGGIERAALEVLRDGLAHNRDAETTLDDLAGWLRSKNACATCATPAGHPATKRRKSG